MPLVHVKGHAMSACPVLDTVKRMPRKMIINKCNLKGRSE